ncbi:helix-turn-helix transcriptional regulator [Halanaeroarchaeum sulfurireducens]|uniref:Uncharacterized protein n=1 Tax=Halanaeroarchaeum sulfurireducens TaxID=1604004 RepID=A0A0F7PFJ9_9EURY|nr:hypothetical protein [Halanaeroarchaeum sulfurireducens]AKH98309.1 hypothetical protein HLASF_1838 [Halanaeroarchaeum sulfurireducens]ALG82703.1 hypothetical protein HLASA_1824 [Halanaeroarchaeum sulfurireducens]
MDKSVEVAKFLADSPHRMPILRTIRDRNRPARADIVDRVDASRRTVKRALDRFHERGWILRENDEIVLTVGGAFVLEAFEDFAGPVLIVEELRPFVSRVRAEDCRAGPAEFENTTIIDTDTNNPFAAVEHLLDQYREATDRAHVLLSYVSRNILKELLETAGNEELDLVIVVDESVRRAIETTPAYRELLERHGENATLHRVEKTFPLSCALIDDTAMVSVTNDEGVPTVLLQSSNRAFVSVIERRIRQGCEQARRFSV